LQLADLLFDSPSNFVANGSDVADVLACGVVEDPVFVAFTGLERTGVAAPHGDDDIGAFDGLGGQNFRFSAAMSMPSSAHGLNGDRVDLVGGFGAGRPNLDLAPREVIKVSGGHLGAASGPTAGSYRKPWPV
jgi:hypothetical protein